VYAHLEFFLSFQQFSLYLMPRHVDQISLQGFTLYTHCATASVIQFYGKNSETTFVSYSYKCLNSVNKMLAKNKCHAISSMMQLKVKSTITTVYRSTCIRQHLQFNWRISLVQSKSKIKSDYKQ